MSDTPRKKVEPFRQTIARQTWLLVTQTTTWLSVVFC